MDKLWRLMLLTYSCLAVEALLLWSCGLAEFPGFLSIDCGWDSASPASPYPDANYNITWISDAELMKEGLTLRVSGYNPPYDTVRLFTGDQSKYCYGLSNSAVVAGAFFLVRATFTSPPADGAYGPKSSDGQFHFKLLIDADEWTDVFLPRGGWIYYEMYTRALRNSIDVCLARSAPGGDNPFISALELRPLPPTLSATRLMSSTNRRFIDSTSHYDFGTATGSNSTTRYSSDSLDRIWSRDSTEPKLATDAAIDTSNDQERPPFNVLQTAFGGTSDTSSSISTTFRERVPNAVYYCVIYFAEIDKRVNASGQRVFDIYQRNGKGTPLNPKPIDVFAAVGAYTSYEFVTGQVSPDSQGDITFDFYATRDSLYAPFYAGTELFKASSQAFSIGSSSNDVIAIEDLKRNLGLSSYTGDPCLPIGFKYSWLTCTEVTTPLEAPRISSISLSNNFTGGEVPKSINTLTMLETILLDGNRLEGSIPDMSALTKLHTLDLSNNMLNGSIPDSLATLTSLRVLKLANNHLTGKIPTTLLQRQKDSTLDLDVSGNPLCEASNNATCISTSPPSSSSKSKQKYGLIIGVPIIVTFIVVIAIALTLFKIYKNRHQPSTILSEQQEIPLYPRSKSTPVMKRQVPMVSIQELTLEEIKLATNNFNTEIGRGGFGLVYKGCLKDGRIVAIKLSSNSPHQGSKEFLNEVDILSRIHHKNLVGLVGFCTEENLILVYEFMSNGSLFDHLHGKLARDSPLSWTTRLKILVDSAQGFDYLHFGCNPQIIHRDIKSSNILLNDKLEAKISDFGISRNRSINESRAPPTALMGSMGYLDPEYLATSTLTDKVDVYSFGVLLFEVVCGRTATFLDTSRKQHHIVEWVRPFIDRGAIDDFIDVAIHGSYNVSSMWKVIDVALACVQSPSDRRPNMSIVYLDLKEAQSMELETSHHNGMVQGPSSTFTPDPYESLPLTLVNPR